jgi:hypothetical protein
MIGGMLGNLVILPLLLKLITPRDDQPQRPKREPAELPATTASAR